MSVWCYVRNKRSEVIVKLQMLHAVFFVVRDYLKVVQSFVLSIYCQLLPVNNMELLLLCEVSYLYYF